MAQVHNVLIRGINSIYNQAKQVEEPNDVKDFMFLIHCYCDLIELHHDHEEAFLFPAIVKLADKPDLLNHSVKQHHGFSEGIRRLHEYSKRDDIEYSGDEICNIIDGFAPALHTHLRDEIQELRALTYLDDKRLMGVFKEAEKGKIPANANEMFPLFFGLVDKDYEGGIHHFPDVPWFVNYLVHYWFAWKHAGSWRFLPCDFWGNRRELLFAL